jgi:hypothetical protein
MKKSIIMVGAGFLTGFTVGYFVCNQEQEVDLPTTLQAEQISKATPQPEESLTPELTSKKEKAEANLEFIGPDDHVKLTPSNEDSNSAMVIYFPGHFPGGTIENFIRNNNHFANRFVAQGRVRGDPNKFSLKYLIDDISQTNDYEDRKREVQSNRIYAHQPADIIDAVESAYVDFFPKEDRPDSLNKRCNSKGAKMNDKDVAKGLELFLLVPNAHIMSPFEISLLKEGGINIEDFDKFPINIIQFSYDNIIRCHKSSFESVELYQKLAGISGGTYTQVKVKKGE